MTMETLLNNYLKISDSTSTAEMQMQQVMHGKLSHHDVTSDQTNQRHVTFNQNVLVRACICIDEYTKEEKRNTWFIRQEYRDMRAEILSTVGIIAVGEYTGDTDQQCARGLEHKTPAGSQRRKARKLACLIAVFDAQDQQRFTGINDPVALASAYTQANRFSRFEASHRGELDAEEVSRIWSGRDSITTISGDSKSRGSSPKERSGKKVLNMFRRNQKQREC